MKKDVLDYFKTVCSIPHPSAHEELLGNYIEEFAQTYHLDYQRNEVGDIIIYKEASPGYEDHAPILLQGHIDMVAEKERDSDHDFLKDPLELYEEDGFLHATKTTLGADDGTAVAIMLSLLQDDSFKHPRLECLFTVQEETTMDGIRNVDPDWISSRRMISLDSDVVGETTVSSAGGIKLSVRKNIEFVESHDQGYKLTIKGLLGGHSGDAIKDERANAVKLAAYLFKDCLNHGFDIRFSSLNAGQKANAICRDGIFTFQSSSSKEELETFIHHKMEELVSLYPLEPITYELEEETSDYVILESDALIYFLALCPSSVLKYSTYFKHFPVLSMNIGIVETTDKLVEITLQLRSENKIDLGLLVDHVDTIASLFGLSVVASEEYYGWSYMPDSKLRNSYKENFKKVFGYDLKECPTHGGLETGYVCRLFPGMDIVTMGPNCIDIHTPQERLEIKTLYEIHDFLKNWLGEL